MVMTTGAFFKDMLSETGPDGKSHISSKRVMGTFVLIISQCCILYLTYRDGSTSVGKSFTNRHDYGCIIVRYI